ncbi:MAG TPA: hypothetical protein VFR70_07240, partial [Flavobacterium sp.]|nr:hypothetical protein [Flavobacterium sp.]
MKKSLLLAMFFGMWGLAWGQKKEIFKNLQKDTLLKDSLKDRQIRTYVVEYDFSTGLFPNRKQIKPRVDVPIIFKIKNINRLAYKIDIACRDSIIGHTDLIGLETLIKKNEAEKLKTDLKKAETPAVVQANILPVNKYDFRKPDKDFTTLIDSINKFEVSLLKKLETKLAEIQSASETKADPANIEKPDSTQKKDTIHIEKANPANIKEPDNTHIEIEIPIILEQKIPYHFTFQVNLT